VLSFMNYTPAKLNLMTLGNELPHLHTHVVPRYVDDGEPGAPPRFMRASIERKTRPRMCAATRRRSAS